MRSKNIFLFTILLMTILLSVNTVTSLDSLGTFQRGEDVRITQVCSDATYINISSVSYPNGTVAVSGIEMTSAGSGEYYYDFNQTSELGRYDVRGISDGCTNTFATYFDATLGGNDPSQANNIFPIALIGLIFGIACVFLFLSFKIESDGVRIFFILSSFVFLMGSLTVSYVVAFDNNLTPGVNNTLTTMMYAFGLILFVVFAYILINQIKEVMHSFQEKKGYEPGL